MTPLCPNDPGLDADTLALLARAYEAFVGTAPAYVQTWRGGVRDADGRPTQLTVVVGNRRTAFGGQCFEWDTRENPDDAQALRGRIARWLQGVLADFEVGDSPTCDRYGTPSSDELARVAGLRALLDEIRP